VELRKRKFLQVREKREEKREGHLQRKENERKKKRNIGSRLCPSERKVQSSLILSFPTLGERGRGKRGGHLPKKRRKKGGLEREKEKRKDLKVD